MECGYSAFLSSDFHLLLLTAPGTTSFPSQGHTGLSQLILCHPQTSDKLLSWLRAPLLGKPSFPPPFCPILSQSDFLTEDI